MSSLFYVFLPNGKVLRNQPHEGVKDLWPAGTIISREVVTLNKYSNWALKESPVNWISRPGLKNISDVLLPAHKAILFLYGIDICCDPYSKFHTGIAAGLARSLKPIT